ncbi:MAG: hypothetical protein ACRESK_04925, partial [Gammaproteobacteria bacterium]
MVVLATEFMLLYLLARLTTILEVAHISIISINGTHAKNLLIASIVTLNVYYFCFTLTNGSRIIEQIILVFLLFAIFYAIDNTFRIKFVATFCTLFVSLSLIQFFFS